MKIDIYTHFMTQAYQDALIKHMGSAYRTPEPWISEIDNRLRLMDKYETMQVLVPSGPPLESIAEPKKAAELARVCNDSVAEVIAKHPDNFISAAAIIPMNNIPAALDEIDRCIKLLKFKGIFVFTPQMVFGKDNPVKDKAAMDHSVGNLPTLTRALDHADYLPIFAKMAQYNLPIWIHPRTSPAFADYSTESVSKYRIFHIFGWPYHTTAAMTRLVFSGIFEKFPGIKIITHHAGANVPFFDKRIEVLYDSHGEEDKKLIKKEPVAYFKMFYADTAVNGSTPALECAHKFFGSKQMLFGSDTPHDYQKGELSIKWTIESIEGMHISQAAKKAIYEGNARKLLKLD